MPADVATTAPTAAALNTSHLLPALGRETVSNAFVATLAQGVRFVANVGMTIVLARLLLPADFGLVAMVTAVTGFLEIFKDAGLSTATVQRASITQPQVSNLFWANLAVGAMITALVAGLAPLLRWFYHEPRLGAVTAAISVTFLFTGGCVQHQAVLRRQMRFSALAAIQIVSTLVSVSIGIVMAVLDFGYWSLVGATILAAMANAVLTWIVCEWRPSWPARGVGTRSLIGFGAHLTGAALLQTVMGTVDTLLLGRWYGPGAVGLYSRGSALVIGPLQQLLSPVAAVLLPSLSRLQHDPARYRRAFLNVLNVLCLFALPATGFLAGAADPLVRAVLGTNWTAAVPIFVSFAIMAAYVPVAGAATWLFTSQGRGRDTLSSSMTTAAISLIAIAVGLFFGPVGVALGLSVSGVLIRLPILFYLAGRRGPVTARDLWRCLLANVPIGTVSFAASLSVSHHIGSAHPSAQLTAAAAASAIASIAAIAVSPGHRASVANAWRRLHGAWAESVLSIASRRTVLHPSP